MRKLSLLWLTALAVGCARPMPADAPATPIPPDPPPPVVTPPAPHTTVTPPAQIFTGTLTVRFTTDRAATVYMTRDGSDPRTSVNRFLLAPPADVQLDTTTTLTWFARPLEGPDEDVHSAFYVRAGAPAGTVSGSVVVGATAAGHEIVLLADGEPVSLGVPERGGELSFKLENVPSGQHQLLAYSDLNDDGALQLFGDLVSDRFAYSLETEDPFRASVEDVRLYLAASKPGLGTLRGMVNFPRPVPNQTLTVAALDASMMQGGGDPQQLLQQLSQGYTVTTNDNDTRYTYVLTDLEPGTYLPVPVLSGLAGGVSMNLLLVPGNQRQVTAGGEAMANFAFGAVSLSGTARIQPAGPTQALIWGMVAARSLSIATFSMQVALMPALFLPNGNGLELEGGFAAQALRANDSFDVRGFTNRGGVNPIPAALGWALNPTPPEPPQASFLATPPSVTLDFVTE